MPGRVTQGRKGLVQLQFQGGYIPSRQELEADGHIPFTASSNEVKVVLHSGSLSPFYSVQDPNPWMVSHT